MLPGKYEKTIYDICQIRTTAKFVRFLIFGIVLLCGCVMQFVYKILSLDQKKELQQGFFLWLDGIL